MSKAIPPRPELDYKLAAGVAEKDLWHLSVDSLEDFWLSVSDDFEVGAHCEPAGVLAEAPPTSHLRLA